MSLDDRASDHVGRNVSSIPLSDPHNPAEQSIGGLVKDATSHMSTLVRAEVELAKTEIIGEVKKGAIGAGLFIVAAVVALYSSFSSSSSSPNSSTSGSPAGPPSGSCS